MKKKLYIIIAVAVVLVIFLAVEFFGLPGGEEVKIYIESGTSPANIYTLLAGEDVIGIKPLFSLYSRGSRSHFKSSRSNS